DSMRGAPWDAYELSDERVLTLGDDGAVVAYRATASRAGSDYTALFASTYVRARGAWRLALHQQPPVRPARGNPSSPADTGRCAQRSSRRRGRRGGAGSTGGGRMARADQRGEAHDGRRAVGQRAVGQGRRRRA